MESVRSDVGGLQDRERVLAGDGARAAIGIGYRDAECALAKAGPHQDGRAVMVGVRRHERHGLRPGARKGRCSFLTLLPDPRSLTYGQVVPRVPQVPRSPIRGLGYPPVWREEHGLDEDYAPDLGRTTGAAELVALAQVAYPGVQRLQGWRAVALAEALPGEPFGQAGEARDVAESPNRVPGRLQLEEERRA